MPRDDRDLPGAPDRESDEHDHARLHDDGCPHDWEPVQPAGGEDATKSEG